MKHWGLVIAHLALNILGHSIDNINAYYICVDLSWLLIPIFLYLNGYKNDIVIVWLLFAINNFVDSILLNIDYYSISEYFFATFVIIFLIKRNVNRRSRKKHLANNN